MDEKGKASYALGLAQVNQTQGEVVFTSEEIRDMAFDLQPLTDEQKAGPEPEAVEPVAVEPAPEEELIAAELRALEAAIDAGNAEAVNRIVGVTGESMLAAELRALEAAIEAGDADAVNKIVGLAPEVPVA